MVSLDRAIEMSLLELTLLEYEDLLKMTTYFCTKNQIEKEVLQFHTQAIKVYEKFSFNSIDIR